MTGPRFYTKNGKLDAIYFDFMKAFATGSHKRLLSKLPSYGIYKDLIKWIKGVLQGR